MTTLTQDRAQTTRDLLTAADTAFASGDMLGGSKKMADAASHALKAAAEPRGWRCDSREDHVIAAKRLSVETGDNIILSGFIGPAARFHYNSMYDYMECEDDFDITRELTRDFVNRVLALVDTDD